LRCTELAAHHFHVAVGTFHGGRTVKANLFRLERLNGHQLLGNLAAQSLFHGIHHEQGDVAGGIGAHNIQLHVSRSL